MRRYNRRGVARCVLEQAQKSSEDKEFYFETHPIADEYRSTYGTKKLEYWATEKNPAGGTGTAVIGMQIDTRNPKAARWPR